MKKIPAFNLQEMLIVLAIIGILLLIALPSLMPLIGKAKSVEAQIQLKALYHSQETHRFLYSRYSNELQSLDFDPPIPVTEGGPANYRYTIIEANTQHFLTMAEAVVDFDGDDDFLGFKLNDSCRNVVYVSTEDNEMATSVWLNTYFGDDLAQDDKLSKLKFIYSIDGIAKNLREVVQNNCVDLIIVDYYTDLFTGSMNNSNEVRSFLNLYDGIVKEFGVTVVFLHHTKKASAGAAPNKNSILGSQGFEAKMRSVMMLTKDKEDSSLRHLCVVKNNYMPEVNKKESYVLRFSEQLSFTNTGERVQLNELADDDWLDEARKLREEGKSLKETAEILKGKGIKTSKSSLDRKLKE